MMKISKNRKKFAGLIYHNGKVFTNYDDFEAFNDSVYQQVREIFAGFTYNNNKVSINYDDFEAFNDFVDFINDVSKNGKMIDLTKVDLETINDIVKYSFTEQELDAQQLLIFKVKL